MYLNSSFRLRFQIHTEAAFLVPCRMSTSTTHIVPSVLPPPTPQLPPAFFSSPVSQLNSLDFFSGGSITNEKKRQLRSSRALDALDDLSTSEIGGGAGASNLGLPSVALDALDGLDSLDSLDDFLDTTPSAAVVAAAENESKAELDAGEKSLDDLLDELNPLETVADPGGLSGDAPKPGVTAVDQLDSLDVLDSFPSVEGVVAPLPAGSIGGTGLDLLSNFSSTGYDDLFLTYYWLNRRPILLDIVTASRW